MSLAGAFHGSAAVKAELLARIDRHLAAGTMVMADTSWDGERGSPMGISIEGVDPADYAAAYGYPLGLAALLDHLTADPAAGFDAAGFVRDWVAVVRPGADLSRVPIDLMLYMLDDLRVGNADPAITAAAIALHRRCRDDDPPSRGAWVELRRAILASSAGGPEGANAQLLEAAAWPVAGARSSLTSALAAWRFMQAIHADPDWMPDDEARKEALLRDIWEVETPAREAGVDVNYHDRLIERDGDLAARFLVHLERTNGAVLGAAERLATACIRLLRAA